MLYLYTENVTYQFDPLYVVTIHMLVIHLLTIILLIRNAVPGC